MATISQIRKRIDKIEQRRNPPQVLKPPFVVFHPSDSPEETAAKEFELSEYERLCPDGEEGFAFAVHLTSYLKPGDR